MAGCWNSSNFRIKFKNFEDARRFVRKLELKNQKEWQKYVKGEYTNKPLRPSDIPAKPSRTYKDKGWISLGDWLGTGSIASRLMKYRKFEDAREFVRKLQLRNQAEWKNYVKGKYYNKLQIPPDIPKAPDQVYKRKGWISWGDWLGTGSIASRLMKYRKFEDAKDFVRKLQLKNYNDWKKISKKFIPEDIPKAPDQVYKNKGWISWGDWLGKTKP